MVASFNFALTQPWTKYVGEFSYNIFELVSLSRDLLALSTSLYSVAKDTKGIVYENRE